MVERLLSFGIFVLGVLLAGVSCIIFYTLKIDAVNEDHQKELVAVKTECQSIQLQIKQIESQLVEKDRVIAIKVEQMQSMSKDTQDKIDGLSSQLTLEKQRASKLVDLLTVATGLHENQAILAVSGRLWEQSTIEQQDKARCIEMRRVIGDSKLSDDQCRLKYQSMNFSLRMQLEAKLRNDIDLLLLCRFHEDLYRDEMAMEAMNVLRNKDSTIGDFRNLLDKTQAQRLLSLIRGDRFSLDDNAAWKEFLDLPYYMRLKNIGDVTKNEFLIVMPILHSNCRKRYF